MNYRDDREALRGRVEGLEQDLEAAQRVQQDDAAKRAQVEQIEARMRETEDNLRVMRAQLAGLGGTNRPKKNLTPLFIGMGTAFLFAMIGALLLVQAPHPAPPPPVSPRQTAEPIPLPPPEVAEPADEPLKPPAPARQVNAQWTGKATSIRGIAGAPGAACIVYGTLESTGDKQSVAQVSVKCSDKVIYDSSSELNGMSNTGYGMAEAPGKEAGTFAYALSYSDIGARSGERSQVSIDTTHGQGAVWTDVVPIFRVEFSVPTLSAPVKGEALLPPKKGKNDLGF
jgi:hypothetical protein